jgi:MFS family permease
LEPNLLVDGLLLGAVLLLSAADRWRLSLLGLLAAYAITAYFLQATPFASLGLVRLGLGVLVCAGLYLSLSGLAADRHSRLPTLQLRRQYVGSSLSLALAAVLIAAGAGAALTLAYPWPGLPAEVSFAAYFLISAGVAILILPGDILRHGFALLLLENGAHILRFANAESADLLELALTGIAVVLLALLIAHLAEWSRAAEPPKPSPDTTEFEEPFILREDPTARQER